MLSKWFTTQRERTTERPGFVSFDTTDQNGKVKREQVDLREASLMLIARQLTGVSSKLALATQLTVLWLQNNALTEVPACVFGLCRLAVLQLCSNRLKSLPSSVSLLTALTDLRVSQNSLTSLPSEIGTLPMLKALAVNQNHIVQLPDSLGERAFRDATMQWLTVSDHQSKKNASALHNSCAAQLNSATGPLIFLVFRASWR
jgi:Leucine-rich repeat (LRR) protein